jgi:death on curing protein
MNRDTIRWLTLEELTMIHDVVLKLDGGRRGIRKPEMLQAALDRPMIERVSVSLFRQAAAYCYDIVRTKPFIDGNKRTGMMAALTFLELNERWPTLDEDAAFELTLMLERSESSSLTPFVRYYFMRLRRCSSFYSVASSVHFERYHETREAELELFAPIAVTLIRTVAADLIEVPQNAICGCARSYFGDRLTEIFYRGFTSSHRNKF